MLGRQGWRMLSIARARVGARTSVVSPVRAWSVSWLAKRGLACGTPDSAPHVHIQLAAWLRSGADSIEATHAAEKDRTSGDMGDMVCVRRTTNVSLRAPKPDEGSCWVSKCGLGTARQPILQAHATEGLRTLMKGSERRVEPSIIQDRGAWVRHRVRRYSRCSLERPRHARHPVVSTTSAVSAKSDPLEPTLTPKPSRWGHRA